MVEWHDMRRFKAGRTSEGHDLFSIPLPPDEDGMIGRECPQSDCQPKYFKISSSVKVDESVSGKKEPSVDYLYCPYCGHRDSLQNFVTHDQLEWVKSMITRDTHRTIQKMFEDAFGRSGTTYSGSFFPSDLNTDLASYLA